MAYPGTQRNASRLQQTAAAAQSGATPQRGDCRTPTQDALQQSESSYRELVQNTNSAIIRWKRDGTITFLNQYAQAFFGYSAKEAVGRHVGFLLPQRQSTDADLRGLAQDIVAHPERYSSNVNENICRDGRRVWMAWTNKAILDEHGHVTEILAVGSDITARQLAENRMRRQNTVLAGIARIFREVLVCQTEEELARVCLAVAEEVTQSKLGFIGEINRLTGKLDGIAISDPGQELCRMSDQSGRVKQVPTGLTVHGIYGRVLRDGKAFLTNDPASHPDSIGIPAGHPPLEAFLGVPLIHAGAVVGMVALANREGGYGPDELEAAESLAPAIVQAFLSKRTEAALRESEKRFKTLAAATFEGIAITERGRYTDVNEQLLDMLGYSREELIGREIASDIAPEDRERVLGNIHQGLESRIEHALLRKDGTRITVEAHGKTVDYHNRKVRFTAIRDVTQRKRTELDQAMATDVLRILNQGAGGLQGLIKEILHRIRQTAGFDAVGLRLRQGEDCPYYQQDGFSGEFLKEENFLCARGADGSIRRDASGQPVLECTCGLVLSGRTDPAMSCFTEGGSCWTNRSTELLALAPEADPRENPRNRCIHAGYQSVALVPIHSGTQIIGLLQLNDRRPDRFTPERIRFFESLANNLGLALQRRQTEEELQRTTQRYALLSETAGALLASQNPQALVEDLCRKVMKHLDCDVFVNFLFDGATGRLRLNACGGIPPQEQQKIQWLDFGVAVCGCVARDRQRIIAEDIQNKPDERTDLVRSYGVQAYCCHPLLAGPHLIGTLSFGSRCRPRFGADEVELMRAVADQVAVAMERIRSEQALRDSEERRRMAIQATQDGIWDLNPQTKEYVWSDRFTGMLGYDKGEIPASEESLTALLHPDDVQRKWNAMERHLRRQTSIYQAEFRMRHKDGSYRWILSRGKAVFDAKGTPVRMVGAHTDITDIRRRQEEIQRLNRTLKALSDSSQAIGRAKEEIQYLMDVCRIIVEDCGHAMVWVGYAQADAGRTVHPVAWAGFDDGYLETLHVTWADDERGRGPTGTAIRTGKLSVCRNFHTDPQLAPWRAEALRRGYCSSIALPLLRDGKAFGALMIYSREPDPFSDSEVKLLTELADDLAFGIEAIRLRKAKEQAEVDLRHAKETAEAASKAKDDFIAVLSHELRNPLNPVLATASMLRNDPRFDTDTREQLEVICRNAELEARLIDDLLDMTRIERGKVELDRRPIELCTIIRRAAEVCAPEIRACKLDFRMHLGTSPSRVNADAARLQQVFWNLIKNAVKFTPAGGWVEVRCHCGGDGFAVIDVRDNGKGIEPEALSRIFNAFEQAERSITRQFGGLGLGLTISKALVEMHGGTIEACSQGRDRGATFTVRLPLLAAEPATPAAAPPAEAPPLAVATRPLRILLVEDHGDTARIMRMLLKAEGHEVQAAGTVAAALMLAGTQAFDLLLSDLGLPDGSGLELMRELRAKGSRLPGIALSGYGQEKDVQETREAGFIAHLTKPVSIPRLKEAIAKAVANGAQAAQDSNAMSPALPRQ